MRRRSLIAALPLLAIPPGSARASERPYRVSLVGDGFDGEAWTTGVRVELEPGWKTYWRMPGDSGIPPTFTWRGDAGVEVLFPVPTRFRDASGETIGYKDEVVFPVRARPRGAIPVRLELDLFLGVCEIVCIPADATASIELSSAARDPEGSRIVAQWLERVPVPGDVATSATLGPAGKPELVLELARPVDDIFVEMEGRAYFHAPVFDGPVARLAIGNIEDGSALAGKALRITSVRQGRGLEQTVKLP